MGKDAKLRAQSQGKGGPVEKEVVEKIVTVSDDKEIKKQMDKHMAVEEELRAALKKMQDSMAELQKEHAAELKEAKKKSVVTKEVVQEEDTGKKTKEKKGPTEEE